MVIVVPLIFVTLVLSANSVPAAVVTTSPTFRLVLLFTVIEVVVAVNDATVLVNWLYLKSVYDPDNVMAEPATPL